VPRRLVVAFHSDWAGSDDIYLLDPKQGRLAQLTFGAGEERDPVFSPDGKSLLYRTNAEGPWTHVLVDLESGQHRRLQSDSEGYRGKVAWSPLQIGSYAYASYRDGGLNLDLRTAAGIRPLTAHPAGDYDPAWRPGTQQIAFVSWREEQQDIHLLDVEDGRLTRLTRAPDDEREPAWHPDGQRLVYVRELNHSTDLWELAVSERTAVQLTSDPYPDRSPVYAPDGTLFWTRYVPGAPFEVHDPHRAGHWQLWKRAVGASERVVPLPVGDMDVYRPAAAFALWPQISAHPLPTPTATADALRPATLGELDVEVAGNHPRLNEQVVPSYQAWREEVLIRSGYDFMGSVSDMFRPLGHSRSPYGHLSWHRTGRAVDTLFEWHDPPDSPNQLLVVRDTLGTATYWRLYLRCREQDGTMGEPLTVAPWMFWFELDPLREPDAHASGGRPGPVPEGYYVDLTRLAARHGWHRIASYEQGDFDWRWDSLGREFWHYQRTDGLTWWQAMRQLYSRADLDGYYSWQVSSEELGLDPAWLQAKGIPNP
jgi:TolB protein